MWREGTKNNITLRGHEVRSPHVLFFLAVDQTVCIQTSLYPVLSIPVTLSLLLLASPVRPLSLDFLRGLFYGLFRQFVIGRYFLPRLGLPGGLVTNLFSLRTEDTPHQRHPLTKDIPSPETTPHQKQALPHNDTTTGECLLGPGISIIHIHCWCVLLLWSQLHASVLR